MHHIIGTLIALQNLADGVVTVVIHHIQNRECTLAPETSLYKKQFYIRNFTML